MGFFGESKQQRYAREIRKAYKTDQLPKHKEPKTNTQRAGNIFERVRAHRKEAKLRKTNYKSYELPTHGTGGRGIRGKIHRRIARSAR